MSCLNSTNTINLVSRIQSPINQTLAFQSAETIGSWSGSEEYTSRKEVDGFSHCNKVVICILLPLLCNDFGICWCKYKSRSPKSRAYSRQNFPYYDSIVQARTSLAGCIWRGWRRVPGGAAQFVKFFLRSQISFPGMQWLSPGYLPCLKYNLKTCRSLVSCHNHCNSSEFSTFLFRFYLSNLLFQFVAIYVLSWDKFRFVRIALCKIWTFASLNIQRQKYVNGYFWGWMVILNVHLLWLNDKI